ncbi:hypothetical protein OV203_41160 [Nannocystis sp. ILAH1]|uniref:hypothetical protein n=1 Tax=unclassified Nannocystis TaxID=2627009 RepID=UPI002271DCE7|nr:MULTISPECIES: hypothetical protein [unclassified Nannocystis]MCY0993620.1 hypothetical protein [Nannocystis sp. ILAH1]MCY1063654.1 hypothetical protein [Nannocystis sp. RBIL2]
MPASSAPDLVLELSVSAVRRLLVVLALLVSLAGLLAELLRHLGELDHPALTLLSLSWEGNLPSWYASVLPLVCAGLLRWIAAVETSDRFYWNFLALGFLAISIDETIALHERLSGQFDVGGVLYFDWVIPAGLLVLVLGLAFLGFLRRLSSGTARRFILAGALYVGGAVLFELPLGWWTERHGDDDLGYALIDWCEETLEFVGLTLFASALLDHLAGRQLRLVTPPGGAPTR